jgi:uncharacterized protein Yka (UPF0111/DUF47 family)
MSRGRWFLPEMPDVLGLLRKQLALTIAGLDAFAAWAGGDPAAAEQLRAAEQSGEAAKRELMNALRAAFVTPLEPEDLFTLSRGVDRVLNYARDLVNESEAMKWPPDGRVAEMASLLGEAMRHIDVAMEHLDSDAENATEAADNAIATVRLLDRAYLRSMAASLDVEDRTERIAGREFYRRCSRIGETVVDIAERVVYSVVKES